MQYDVRMSWSLKSHRLFRSWIGWLYWRVKRKIFFFFGVSKSKSFEAYLLLRRNQMRAIVCVCLRFMYTMAVLY